MKASKANDEIAGEDSSLQAEGGVKEAPAPKANLKKPKKKAAAAEAGGKAAPKQASPNATMKSVEKPAAPAK